MDFKAFALIAVVILAATQLDSQANNEWQSYKVQQGKTYSTDIEEAYRLSVFLENLAIIEAHNADETQTYKKGINQFTDLTQEEFEAAYLMEKQFWTQEENQIVEDFVPVGDVNWVTQGAVQRVKDQGSCGSCWAFGAVAAVESSKFIDTGVLGAMSEQQLTSCDTSNSGCSGGLRDRALNYIASAGICTESSYPYTSGTTGSSGTCNLSSCVYDSYTITGSSPQIRSYNELVARLNIEPICTGVDASNWSSYSSGIFSNCSNRINHGVLSAGYTSSYLLIKNSWGAFWGESGYIRLAAGNTCGSGDRNYYPLR